MHSFRVASCVAILILAGAAAFAQTPVIAGGGVLNGASFDKTGQPVAVGSLVSIFGTNLAAATAYASSIPLPSSLSSVTVTFNNIAAPLAAVVHDPVNGDQINAQVPWEILPLVPPGTNGTARIPVIVTRNGISSDPAYVFVSAAAPGIFTFQYGVGQAVAYGNTDHAVAGPGNANLPYTSHPAKIGDPQTLVILATGLGAVANSVLDGDVPSVITSSTLVTPVVIIGGTPAQVVFSGLVGRDAYGQAQGFTGVYQINVIVQPGTQTGNAVPLQISMNGITSRADVTIAVSN